MKNKIEFEIADATFDTYVLVNNSVELLFDFFEQYIDSDKSKQTLAFDVEHRPKRIAAKICAILELLNQAKDNLDELQGTEQGD